MLYHGRLELPYYKIGRKIFVDTEDVASYIESKKTNGKEEFYFYNKPEKKFKTFDFLTENIPDLNS